MLGKYLSAPTADSGREQEVSDSVKWFDPVKQGNVTIQTAEPFTKIGQNTKHRSQAHILKAAPQVHKCINIQTGDASEPMKNYI